MLRDEFHQEERRKTRRRRGDASVGRARPVARHIERPIFWEQSKQMCEVHYCVYVRGQI